uniref:Uncharacterized protein n=1 Tax=Tetranychus urticae TaxID=32264 RepID=T1KX96_TETUR
MVKVKAINRNTFDALGPRNDQRKGKM